MNLTLSIKRTPWLLAATILLQSFSLLSLKVSTLTTGLESLALIIAALGFVGLRAVLWQYLLGISDLSRIYPFVSLVQVLVFAYAVVLFGEVATAGNLLGLALMLAGVYFMSR